MWILAMLPFLLQAIAIGVDELYFHLRRGLPLWERIGHPLDTLSVLLCMGYVLFVPYSKAAILPYLLLSTFSCLMVTKDEFVHKEHCPALEHWLHALLFLLHPITLITAALIWPISQGASCPEWLSSWLSEKEALQMFLKGQFALMAAFMTYQIVYWNFVWKEEEAVAKLHDCGKSMILGRFTKYGQSQSDRIDGGLPNRAGEEMRLQNRPKGRFYASKSFATGSINNDFYDTLETGWYTDSCHPVALLRAENRLRVPWVVGEIAKEFQKPITVLDIGCGAGFLTNALAKQNHQVTGIDLSQRSLEIAKQYDTTQSVNYSQANAYALPFSDASFDVVCAMDILEHVEEPNRLIQEASRVLKPQGLFFFHTFNRNFLSYVLVIKGVEWCVKNAPKNMHVYSLFITPKELTHLCKNSHLQVQTLLGCAPKFLSFPFLKMLCTRTVSDDFTFRFSRSLKTGYSGIAKKREGDLCLKSH